MRITVFGAGGPTGRLLVDQAIAGGHEVVAVTRRPRDFPDEHERVEVTEADVRDPERVAAAVEGADAVLSTLGVPFTRKRVTVYNAGTHNIVAAMWRHGVRRLAVVSSSATEPHHHADGGFLLNRVVQPLITSTIGRTTYADMRRMERLVRASGLAWTIIRPSALFDTPDVTSYDVHEHQAPGIVTSRADLAASLLAQATDSRFVHTVIAVTTVEGAPTLLQLVRREAFQR